MNPNLQILTEMSLAFGVGAPYIAAALQHVRLPPWANELIAFLVCLCSGLVSFFIAGGTFATIHSLPSLFAAVSVIFTGAKLYYVKLGYKSPLLMWLKGIGLSVAQQQSTQAAGTLPGVFIPTVFMPPAPLVTVAQPLEDTIRADEALTVGEIKAGHALIAEKEAKVEPVITETPAPVVEPFPASLTETVPAPAPIGLSTISQE